MMLQYDFTRRAAVVTGAAGGMGRAASSRPAVRWR
jgi:NAD(P)-dependent dehydrogenase (short-subunit alcohol dehydrogenase family)